MKKKNILAANWKMFKTPDDVVLYFKDFKFEKSISAKILFFPQALLVESVARALRSNAHLQNIDISLGLQNAYFEKEGAFTGENSPAVLSHFNLKSILIGHSERRSLFFENDDIVAKKVRTALDLQLHPILCIGETLEQRQSGKTLAVIEEQLNKGLSLVKDSLLHLKNSAFMSGPLGPGITAPLTIAYEPVWAIGTGQVATPDQAEEVHAAIRLWLESQFSKNLADQTQLLYGGSVKPDNALMLSQKRNIDGFLVGGASLKPKDFIAIAQAFEI